METIEKDTLLDMQNELRFIFANVNNWLNFAEIKNSALVVTNIAVIAGILAELSNLLTVIYFRTMLSLFTAALIITSFSFLPIIQNNLLKTNIAKRYLQRYKGIDNLQFYAYISSLNTEEFLERIFERYAGNKINVNRKEFALCFDLASEIVENSKITVYKYFVFRISISLTFLGLILLFSFFLCG